MTVLYILQEKYSALNIFQINISGNKKSVEMVGFPKMITYLNPLLGQVGIKTL